MSVRNILEGTIKIEGGGGGGGGGGEIPEDLRLKSLTVDKIRCGGEISAANVIASSKIEGEDLHTTGLLVISPYFRLGGTRVLMQETDSERNQNMRATLANGR